MNKPPEPLQPYLLLHGYSLICSLEKVERDNSLVSRTEVRAVKYPMRGLTFHNDAARYESSTAGGRRVKNKIRKRPLC